MRSEEEVYHALEQVFQDVFLRDDIKLSPTLNASDVNGWDSFKQIEIIMAVESRFGIRLKTREMDSLANVGDLVRVIMSK